MDSRYGRALDICFIFMVATNHRFNYEGKLHSETSAIHVCLQVFMGPAKANPPNFNPPNPYWVLIRQSLALPKIRSIR